MQHQTNAPLYTPPGKLSNDGETVFVALPSPHSAGSDTWHYCKTFGPISASKNKNIIDQGYEAMESASAISTAINNTYGKGYNPEMMEQLWAFLQEIRMWGSYKDKRFTYTNTDPEFKDKLNELLRAAKPQIKVEKTKTIAINITSSMPSTIKDIKGTLTARNFKRHSDLCSNFIVVDFENKIWWTAEVNVHYPETVITGLMPIDDTDSLIIKFS